MVGLYSIGLHLAELKGGIGFVLSQVQAVPEMQAIPLYVSSPVWTQILTALVIGLLTAFALQFLLASLGLAIGISIWGIRSLEDKPPESSATAATDREPEPSQENSGHVGTWAGLGLLLMVNTVLFAACFLATKFTQMGNPISGAIAGTTIWSAYLLLLIWLSTTAVSSLLGSLLQTTLGGFRRLITPIATLFRSEPDESLPTLSEQQQLAAIRQEIEAALDSVNLQQIIEEQLQTTLTTYRASQLRQWHPLPVSSQGLPSADPSSTHPLTDRADASLPEDLALWQKVAAYLDSSSAKKLTSKRVDRSFQKLLQDTYANEINQPSLAFDRSRLMGLLNQREDLSEKRKDRILNQMEDTWKQFWEVQSENSKTDEFEEDITPETYSESTSESISELAIDWLQSASGKAAEQVLSSLPDILQRLKSPLPQSTNLALMVLSAVMNRVNHSIDLEKLKSLNGVELEPYLKYFIELSRSELGQWNQSLVGQIEHYRDRSLEQIEAIQQKAQDQMMSIKRQTQQRLEETRKAAATAIWWLFITFATGALSSALAGALASGFDLYSFLSRMPGR